MQRVSDWDLENILTHQPGWEIALDLRDAREALRIATEALERYAPEEIWTGFHYWDECRPECDCEGGSHFHCDPACPYPSTRDALARIRGEGVRDE